MPLQSKHFGGQSNRAQDVAGHNQDPQGLEESKLSAAVGLLRPISRTKSSAMEQSSRSASVEKKTSSLVVDSSEESFSGLGSEEDSEKQQKHKLAPISKKRATVILDSDDSDESDDSNEENKPSEAENVRQAKTVEIFSSSEDEAPVPGRKKRILLKKASRTKPSLKKFRYNRDETVGALKDDLELNRVEAVLNEESDAESADSASSDDQSGPEYSSSDDGDAVADLFERCESISKRLTASAARLDQATLDVQVDGDGDTSVVTRVEADKLFPEGLSLKDYQLVGLNWLRLLYAENMNGILADEMGLGKTVQAISIMAWMHKVKGIKGPHLVVAPASTLENWRRELERFVPEHKTVVFHGSQKHRAELIHDMRPRGPKRTAPFDILLTTYTYFERDSCGDDRKFISKFKFWYMITDEAHGIKNMMSSRYRRMTRIQTKRRVLLSGTPVQNNLEELLALMSFCMPKVFDSESEQLSAFFKGRDHNATARIRKMMKPFVLRRLKADVLGQLSPKVEDIKILDASSVQRKVYDKIIDRYRQSKEKLTNELYVAFFSELRKCANHPLLVRSWFGATGESSPDGVDRSMEDVISALIKVAAFGPKATRTMISNEISSYSDWDLHLLAVEYGRLDKKLESMKLPDTILWNSCKAKQIGDMVPKLIKEDHRVLIFSQWTTILDLIGEMMDSMGVSFLRFDGSTAVNERQKIVDSFNTDMSYSVCLLSTRAGGMGINLTSADTVIIHDLDFNPSLDRQAEDRCHRIGQTKEVRVIKLVTKNTVDENILHIQTDKKRLEALVMSGQADERIAKGAKDPIKLIMEQL
mmetsp:Transcript_11447/g.21203  ORF Transcript_11447/g.21203 Transcript_11447/m.21203 type:complete len:817 (+) Transcript_11447:85-2535(+)